MPKLTAEFVDRHEIRFDVARENGAHRTFTNVRVPAEDGSGPVDFTSVDLLLIAVGNCTLGYLLNNGRLADAEVTKAVANVEATMQEFPRQVGHIHSEVEIEVTDPALLDHREEIEIGACGGPMCAALGDLLSATVTLKLKQ
ncbi:MAG: hypothetical protein KC461_12315 [Dehalococcoidia bacterium]|nr:hypothetical protein [Dehalococcoidia bacterium]MCB9482643.1 hypothetical protein [Dehalococcoidia bacterium]MCB9491887.1 hypothetical protein [Dehalococcoidia bacterium]